MSPFFLFFTPLDLKSDYEKNHIPLEAVDSGSEIFSVCFIGIWFEVCWQDFVLWGVVLCVCIFKANI